MSFLKELLQPRTTFTAAQKAILQGRLAAFASQFATDTGIKLVPIPVGTFIMGSPADEKGRLNDEGPQTRVTLTKEFFLGATVVTQGQYEAVIGTFPSEFYNFGKNAPVENVSWYDAMAFCQKLTERECAAGRLPEGYTFTLPTEAQWEYACRAGATGPYAGDLDAMAWYGNNSGGTTHPVALKQSNAWGLYDMHGNVMEWCLDWYWIYPGGAVAETTGPTSESYRAIRDGHWHEEDSPEQRFARTDDRRVMRGAGRHAGVSSCRFASRSWERPRARVNASPGLYGFRLALSSFRQSPPPSVAPASIPAVASSAAIISTPPLTAAQKAILQGRLAAFASQFATDTGIKLVPIPAGTFIMGSPADEKGRSVNNEKPQTPVTLTKNFFLGATQVTQGQYEAVIGYQNSKFYKFGKDAPVENVSWDEAMAFCHKLTERERAAGRLPRGYAFTLPTEAQWEYACRAGTTGPYAGDLDAMAWYRDNSGGTTHPVASKQPNAWGLYDMHGNVWEWCLDWQRRYTSGAVTDPTGPTSKSDVVYRGGDCMNDAEWCRSACRCGHSGIWFLLNVSYGFRLALTRVTPRLFSWR